MSKQNIFFVLQSEESTVATKKLLTEKKMEIKELYF